MLAIYNTLLFQPMLNALVFFYNVIPGHDIGIAIILLTILIKLILLPFSLQSLRSQKSMQQLQPKIEALKERYKDKKDDMAKAMMELYKKEKVNPLSSCLPLLVQFPFLIAVYGVFRDGLASKNFEFLYPFVSNPGSIASVSFGLVDLAKASIWIAVLAGLAQFVQAKMMIAKRPPADVRKKEGARDEDMAAVMNKQMLYFMPVITVFIGASLPAGLALYWFVTTVLTIAQQWFFLEKKKSLEIKTT